ncbi:MAG TPA: hypothetical protein VIY72_16870 [Acidimicrobiales bacterium]
MTDELDSGSASDAQGSLGISRRHLLAAAAWTVPVILVAQATPAAASSPAVTFTGVGCTHMGFGLAGNFHFTLRVIHTPGGPNSLTVTAVSVGPYPDGPLTPRNFNRAFLPAEDQLPKTFQLFGNDRSIIVHAGGDNGGSALVYAQVTYTYGSPSPLTVTSGPLATGPCTFDDDSGGS